MCPCQLWMLVGHSFKTLAQIPTKFPFSPLYTFYANVIISLFNITCLWVTLQPIYFLGIQILFKIYMRKLNVHENFVYLSEILYWNSYWIAKFNSDYHCSQRIHWLHTCNKYYFPLYTLFPVQTACLLILSWPLDCVCWKPYRDSSRPRLQEVVHLFLPMLLMFCHFVSLS